jgi:hypothetical protein
MKTIFDEALRTELINRIKSIPENSTATPGWGKMTLFQMLSHGIIWEEWIHGKKKPVYKQAFIGWVFGKFALKGILKDDGPLKRNMPSGEGFSVKEKSGAIGPLKKRWVSLIEDYATYSNPAFIHDFFGKMSVEQIGILAYKHTDHHLRQFGY